MGRGRESRKPTSKWNHIVTRRRFREFLETHPGVRRDAATLHRWCHVVEKADWREFAHVKATFASADQVNDLVVFNVGGNKYRVVAFILFKPDRPAWIYIKHVVTHQEYDDLDLGGET